MCGIAGIVTLRPAAEPPSRNALLRMAAALKHRGPDEFGLYRDGRAGLAHARLSIIDLASGQQPLADQDERTWIVFNGEIFNYLELRDELIARGHSFRTKSDTEVIVQAYRAWGEAAFERLQGQWAVALWDSRAQRLVLSRDRVGICPLHFCEHDGRLYFASEVKAIFAADARIPRAFDADGLDQVFTFWCPVAPRSVWLGVSELPPGHVRVYEGGTVREHAYWTPRYPVATDEQFTGSIEDAAAEVRSALDAASSQRVLRADVPVGSYLSGGLDSSLVAALGRRVAGERFQTFSLRFEDAEYDETAWQRLVARTVGSEHYEVLVSRDDIAAVFPDVVRHAERPLLRTAPAPLFLLSRLVRRRGIKVVLTGEGADEIFAGYDLFREGKVRRFWARAPGSKWRARLLERLYPYLERSPVAAQAMARQFFGRGLDAHASPGFAHQMRWRSTAALKRLLSREMRSGRDAAAELLGDLPEEFSRWASLSQDQYLEIRTLLSGYLLASQGDRMLMANSVEGRFPFLDEKVMALANSLPPEWKLRVLDEKHILKKAAAELAPPEIVARKKQPYRAPDALAFTGGSEWVEEMLSEAALRRAGVFDPALVAQLDRKRRGAQGQFSNADNMALVGVLSTQLLHRELIARRETETTIALRTDVDRTLPRMAA
jgi:asparagine synthase (glutamine-hydrolysing)